MGRWTGARTPRADASGSVRRSSCARAALRAVRRSNCRCKRARCSGGVRSPVCWSSRSSVSSRLLPMQLPGGCRARVTGLSMGQPVHGHHCTCCRCRLARVRRHAADGQVRLRRRRPSPVDCQQPMPSSPCGCAADFCLVRVTGTSERSAPVDGSRSRARCAPEMRIAAAGACQSVAAGARGGCSGSV